MSKIKVRPYESGEETQIVELLTETFDGWPHEEINCSPVDYWRWKYLDNPVYDNLVMLGEDNGRIIGCHHKILLNIIYKNKVILGTTSVDLAVHRDYRNQGLMTTISVPNEVAGEEKGVKLSYFITSNPILIKTFTQSKNIEKRRPRFPRRIRNLVLLNDVDLQLQMMPMDNSLLFKLGWNTLNVLNKITNRVKPTIQMGEPFQVKQIERFDESVNQFWNKIKGNYDFIVERRMEYLNWRYCDPRLFGFKVNIAVDDNDMVLGYIIYKINRYNEDYSIGYIVDLITLNNRLDVQYQLIDTAVRYFKENMVNVINYQLVEGSQQQSVFKRHGFLDSRINIHLFYNKYREFKGLDDLTQSSPTKIHISWGDHDALPVRMPTQR